MINYIYGKFLFFIKKEENKELLLHSLLALIIRAIGAGAAFFMNVIVARYLGIKEAGYFFLAVVVVKVLSTIGRVGADKTVLRFVSVNSSKNEWGNVRFVLHLLNKWAIILVSLLTILLCVFAKQISIYGFHKPELEWPLFWCALSMPFFALYNIHAQALQGLRKVIRATSSLQIITPALIILLVVLFTPHGSNQVAFYYFIACLVNLSIVLFWWHRRIPHKEKYYISISKSQLWQSCFPLWVMIIMQQLVSWSGQFVAGVFNSPQEISQLTVANNTSVLISFILTAVNFVSAPRFATMYNERKMEQLKSYALNTTRLLTISALPIVILILLFPDVIMSLFGRGFSGGAWLLRIFVVGQFVNVLSGSVGYLLVMSGHERDVRNIMIISGCLAIVLALILNPLLGVMGSAISTAIAVAASNLLGVGLVKKRLGFNVLKMFSFKK